jgi:hypothetical protein
MAIPKDPPKLSQDQLEQLNQQLSNMRHEVNNQLSLMLAAIELIRFRPEMRERMFTTLAEQPGKITAQIAKFSAEFEQALGITHD